jgi:hypothetical protein
MPHTTRKTYKDKAGNMLTQTQVLKKALDTIENLKLELSGRREREEELYNAIIGLSPPLQQLSGNLRGCAGDFGVGVDYPDTQIDTEAYFSRPAVFLNRVCMVMNMASQRLNEIHLEHEESAAVAGLLDDEISATAHAAMDSIQMRTKLLVLGGSYSAERDTYVQNAANPYLANDRDLDLEEIYETKGITLSEDEEEELNKLSKEQKKIKREKKRATKKRGFLMR